ERVRSIGTVISAILSPISRFQSKQQQHEIDPNFTTSYQAYQRTHKLELKPLPQGFEDDTKIFDGFRALSSKLPNSTPNGFKSFQIRI
ncbi:hypothetical protein ACQ1ZA_15400, partial [Enterococcus faecalis]|uniref:hypothetical protein n=1 Tax=Enterococcus faecalis TaxID=1351 RepID=UPI003D6A66DC